MFVNEKEIEGEVKQLRSVAFQKVYKDQEGNWKTTSSLSRDDLPKAMIVLGKAFEHLSLREYA